MTNTKKSNSLLGESSPYLQQHAYNPVNWKPWKNEHLEQALQDKKLVLISIGYAACHWCHVMEEESFEDEEVAQIMNSDYVNIKVDREERPDVDQVYMNAIQLMTGSGGWPMNVVALPDGRPVWGGTYFRKEQWKNALTQIAHLYKTQPEKLYEYADKLEKGLEQLQLIPDSQKNGFTQQELKTLVENWMQGLDHEYGGEKRAPKFPVPTNFSFLLHYSKHINSLEIENYVVNSLTKISYGGIYDHVGGGFSRYSVDERWHIPHFEKMLYDNAQLVSLYSKAFRAKPNKWFKKVVIQTLNFIKEELTDIDDGFYSSLDADSLNSQGKLKEGAYYSWKKQELQKLLGATFPIFREYYNVNPFGEWEEDEYVLIRTKTEAEVAEKFKISEKELNSKIENCISILKKAREKRAKPRLDHKKITSWNALMLMGYLEAYKSFGQTEYMETAKKSAYFITTNLMNDDFGLFHTKGKNTKGINAYLEDYAFVIQALLNLYEVTLEEKWLKISNNLNAYCLENFYSAEDQLFYFTSAKDRPLISRPFEVSDTIIPSSNAVMAENLFKLSKFNGDNSLRKMCTAMLQEMEPKIKEYPRGASQWMEVLLNELFPYYEVVVMGNNAVKNIAQIAENYLPNILIDGSIHKANNRALTKNRYKEGSDLIYVCEEGTCQLPHEKVNQSLDMLHFNKN